MNRNVEKVFWSWQARHYRVAVVHRRLPAHNPILVMPYVNPFLRKVDSRFAERLLAHFLPLTAFLDTRPDRAVHKGHFR